MAGRLSPVGQWRATDRPWEEQVDILRHSWRPLVRWWWPGRRRSAGVLVSGRCHRSIRRADAARDRRDWKRAAEFYNQALNIEPRLAHIATQLGHALKEDGRLAGAERVYMEAYNLDPDSRDVAMQLGHILKMRGAWEEAARRYASVVLRDPGDEEAMREVFETLERVDLSHGREIAAGLLARIANDSIDLEDDGPAGEYATTIVYDVSDFLKYVRRFRRPTGIQRVQIEVLLHALHSPCVDERIEICYFNDARGGWIKVSPKLFLRLASLSITDEINGNSSWLITRNAIHLKILMSTSFDFPWNTVLVSLGNSWSIPNYFLHVRDAKRRYGIQYIPMVYDLIPVLHPDFFTDELVKEFLAWLVGVFDHADAFLSISEATKRDLIDAAARVGVALDPDHVTVVRLDAEFASARRAPAAREPATDLPAADSYVLFVSTIEPRKGHVFAFEAWTALVRKLGANRVPRLICVGRSGWRNDAVYEALERVADLGDHITLLSDVSDETLAALYRGSLFVIYPSLYEGWGLPITEALCYGKVVVTTTAAALPEAGGSYAVYVTPADANGLADAAELLISDPEARRARERRIAKEFRPRSWVAIGGQIMATIRAMRATPSTPGPGRERPPAVRWGVFYSLGLVGSVEIKHWRDAGEIFRAGTNWFPIDDGGARTKPGGGLLACRVSEPGSMMTLQLVGGRFEDRDFRIFGAQWPIAGILPRGERRSISFRPIMTLPGLVQLRIEDVTASSAHSESVDLATFRVEGFLVHGP